jgi:uncharacterized protein YfdQ (DUF2303 family)
VTNHYDDSQTLDAAPARTEADSIAEVARLSTEPHELTPGSIYAFATAGGIETIDLDLDKYRDTPRRKTGTIRVEDLDSFFAYWGKHADDDSELYVNVDRHTITAVLDANQAGGPRWAEHRLVLALKTTDRWRDWTGYDRTELRQVQFAEFIEDHLDDIREPSAAEMLEIATTFQAQTKVRFTSNVRLTSGQRTLQWEETTDAKAGEAGKLTVPTEFKIGVAPFDFCEAVSGITARFRYRMNNGNLIVLYLLNDPDRAVRDAMLDLVGQIEDKTQRTVMRGTPA